MFQEYTGISSSRCAEIIASSPRGHFGELILTMTSDEDYIARQYFRYHAKGNMSFNSMIHAASRGEL